jgi:hypothetical protein
MTLLLDTHAFLWFWWADPLLSATASAVICDPANRKLISPASSWEIAIKVSRNKLDLGAPFNMAFNRLFNEGWCPRNHSPGTNRLTTTHRTGGRRFRLSVRVPPIGLGVVMERTMFLPNKTVAFPSPRRLV